MATSGANAVLLPKVENAEQVRELQGLLMCSGAPCDLDVWCMIETPRGVLNVAEICRGLEGPPGSSGGGSGSSSSNALTVLCMGFADLGKELHAPQIPGRHNFITSAQLCLLAARAYGLVILDGVHLNLDDLQDFERECQQGVEWGMDGKTLIHPKQIAAANAAFAPGEAEVDSHNKTEDQAAEPNEEQQAKVQKKDIPNRRVPDSLPSAHANIYIYIYSLICLLE